MPILELTVAGGETLDIHRFSLNEAVSTPFSISLIACSENPAVDLEAIVGQPARFRIVSGLRFARFGGVRQWTGVVSSIDQVQAVRSHAGSSEISTYHVRLAPKLWLLSHRRNHRIFQHLSIPDIADKLLSEWGVAHAFQIDRGAYPKLEYKVQYGESDFAFLSRLFEEAGIAFTFEDGEGETTLVLGDALERRPVRAGGLPFVDNPNAAAEQEYVSRVLLSHEVRPGAHTIRDYDFRKPAFPLFGKARTAASPEDEYEQYHYEPSAFLVEGASAGAGATPVADDRGIARHDQPFGDNRSERMLLGDRLGRRSVAFDTNAIDLAPGRVFVIEGHPHAEISDEARLLVTSFQMAGSPGDEWTMSGAAVFTDVRYRPAQRTPKPHVEGIQSAVVVGPKGQEIHTDEFGRVRVQFPWDREGKLDEKSSCWIRVSQGWAGTGYGMIVLPRIGQEVLVGFLGGNPDAPIVVGRTFNATQAVPYKLPEHKTRSTWKSDSSMGSDGFNEIMFEDLKGKELVYVQAQKNLRKLVKNDETITVGRNRQKLVVVDETETTGGNRVEVTGVDRTEITDQNRTTVIGADKAKLVRGNETERTEGNLTVFVGHDQDIVVRETRRERIEKDSHLRIGGDRSERIDGIQSLTVGKNQQETVGKNHALEAGQEIHIKAGSALVIEAAKDLTLKGPGGFIRIDGSGITIKGTLVKINSGGAAGEGHGSHPVDPEDAIDAVIVAPEKPEPDNVAKTGFAQ